MADLSDQENAAGLAAAKLAIAQNVPEWEQSMIPDGALTALVAEVVKAVDSVRAAAAADVANIPRAVRDATIADRAKAQSASEVGQAAVAKALLEDGDYEKIEDVAKGS